MKTQTERQNEWRDQQKGRNQKEVRLWVDKEAYEAGHASFVPGREPILTYAVAQYKDIAGYVLGWRKAQTEWVRTNGKTRITQKQIDLDVEAIKKLSDTDAVINLQTDGTLRINGEVAPEQLRKLLRLSSKVKRSIHAPQG